VFIERHKAGSPTDAKVYWIHLKPKEIALKFELETGFKVSNGFVKRLLKTLGFKYRKLSKTLATGDYARRDEQFKIIFQLVATVSLKTPILSIDCKKKERLGNLYRDGKMYCTAPIEVFDHDYGHLSKGIVIPHGIYDLQRNEGYVSIGSSHETAEFTKDNLLWWWDNFGIHYYPDTSVILILCDAVQILIATLSSKNKCRYWQQPLVKTLLFVTIHLMCLNGILLSIACFVICTQL
jgi:hypothetical protein